jgi:hypothetical protein
MRCWTIISTNNSIHMHPVKHTAQRPTGLYLCFIAGKTYKSFASIPSRKTIQQTLLFHPEFFGHIF